MDEIVASVKRVTDIMGEISAASQEQSAGIEQVNQAVTQMDEVTQQNAALVEQAAAAAESLQEQAAAGAGGQRVQADGDASTAPQVARVLALPANRRPAAPPRASAGRSAAPAKRLAVANAASDWEEF